MDHPVMFVPSEDPRYRTLEQTVSYATDTLLDRFPEPSPSRFALSAGAERSPGSVAIVMRFEGAALDLEASRALGLYLARGDDERCYDRLRTLTGGAPVHQIELIESFEPRRGYAKAIVEALSDRSIIASPLPNAIGFYERLGFRALDVYDSVPDRPLMLRNARNG